MPNFNHCTVMGHLARNPELKYTQSGSPICEITIAVSRKSKDREDVCFVDIVVWGKAGESCQKYLTKGKCAMVDGYLKQDTWTDNSGNRRSKIRIVAESVQFIGGNRTEHDSPASPPPASQPAPAPESKPEQPSLDYSSREPGEDDIPF
ncbi:MAG: single-stranded DNA-binding protein [Victivallaceae bacterium]